MNFDYVVHFYIIKGSFSVVFAFTLVIIMIGTPFYIFYLEDTGTLPRMLEHRPNTFNKIKTETRVSKNKVSENRTIKIIIPQGILRVLMLWASHR